VQTGPGSPYFQPPERGPVHARLNREPVEGEGATVLQKVRAKSPADTDAQSGGKLSFHAPRGEERERPRSGRLKSTGAHPLSFKGRWGPKRLGGEKKEVPTRGGNQGEGRVGTIQQCSTRKGRETGPQTTNVSPRLVKRPRTCVAWYNRRRTGFGGTPPPGGKKRIIQSTKRAEDQGPLPPVIGDRPWENLKSLGYFPPGIEEIWLLFKQKKLFQPSQSSGVLKGNYIHGFTR